MREAFLKNLAAPDQVISDRPAMVIGGGGAARSAVYALRKWLKVRDIYLVNRDKSEVDAVIAECTARGYGRGLVHVRTAEQAESLEGPGAIVACVPDFPPRQSPRGSRGGSQTFFCLMRGKVPCLRCATTRARTQSSAPSRKRRDGRLFWARRP